MIDLERDKLPYTIGKLMDPAVPDTYSGPLTPEQRVNLVLHALSRVDADLTCFFELRENLCLCPISESGTTSENALECIRAIGCTIDPVEADANLLILALKATGFNDRLEDDGKLGTEYKKAIAALALLTQTHK